MPPDKNAPIGASEANLVLVAVFILSKLFLLWHYDMSL